MAFGPCIGCGRVFAFNPARVPSSSAVTGEREPICGDCVVTINRVRREHGLPQVEVLPGAYDPCEEGELG